MRADTQRKIQAAAQRRHNRTGEPYPTALRAIQRLVLTNGTCTHCGAPRDIKVTFDELDLSTEATLVCIADPSHDQDD